MKEHTEPRAVGGAGNCADNEMALYCPKHKKSPEKIQVFVAPGEILILAERHEGEPTDAARAYLISELPFGIVGRVIGLPEGKWRYHDAEAHFANGLLTVTIPTEARAEYLKDMHAAA